MSEFHAAVGLTMLDDIESMIDQRCEMVEHYLTCLAPYDVEFPKRQEGTDRCSPSYMPLILNSVKERDCLHKMLFEEGIETRKYFEGLINNLAAYSNQPLCLPNAEVVENRLLCLPFYVDLDSADISYICERVVAALDEIRSKA
jgi:dTDP-4-amino-4,6-dideoxygalactose transaminase